jgi:LemA protein
MSLIILIIFVVLFVLFIYISVVYNKFQDYIIKINEVEGKIDETLRKKFDSILDMNNIIKESIKTKKAIVDDISILKNKKISSFELDRKLVDALNKISFIKEQYDELKGNEKLSKLTYEIEDMNESLDAYKKFYNEKIVSYNKLIRIFPYNILGKILKYKEKTFFDGKDMNDDDVKDFKL